MATTVPPHDDEGHIQLEAELHREQGPVPGLPGSSPGCPPRPAQATSKLSPIHPQGISNTRKEKFQGKPDHGIRAEGAAGVVAVPAGGVEGTGILLLGQESLGDLLLLLSKPKLYWQYDSSNSQN